jgi:hypothetical protein
VSNSTEGEEPLESLREDVGAAIKSVGGDQPKVKNVKGKDKGGTTKGEGEGGRRLLLANRRGRGQSRKMGTMRAMEIGRTEMSVNRRRRMLQVLNLLLDSNNAVQQNFDASSLSTWTWMTGWSLVEFYNAVVLGP